MEEWSFDSISLVKGNGVYSQPLEAYRSAPL